MDNLKGDFMKKAILGFIFAAFAAGAMATTGYLTGEQVKGQWKYCYYSNGKVVTVKAYKICPRRA